MTPPDAYKAIYATWIAAWPGLSTNVPYAIDNRKIAQPSPPFAIVSITNLTADQVTMGKPGLRRFERPGWIDVKLYGARDQGRGALDTLAEHVRTIFEATRIGATPTHHGITTYAMSVSEVRNDREYPDLWVLLCRTGFEYHERR